MYEESRMLYDGVYGAQKMEGLRMQDFVRIQERYRAFWNRENETPLLWLCAPRAHTDYSRAPRRPEKTEDRWLDFAYVIRSHRVWMENTYYGGDAYPNFMPNLGPDILGAICGGDIAFGETTSWARPCVAEWEGHPDIVFDENNVWWQRIRTLTEMAVADSRGDYCVQITDLHAGMDALVSLRGAQELCMDVLDCPGLLQRYTMQVYDVFREVYDRLYAITSRLGMGTTNWLNIWSDRKWYVTSCDFSCLISPEQFAELVLPELRAELSYLDGSVWHLDGTQCARHLDALLSLEKLNGIQYVNSEFDRRPTDYLPMIRKIQQHGKLFQMAIGPEDLDAFLTELEPQGLFLTVSVKDESEAREIEEYVARYYRRRR